MTFDLSLAKLVDLSIGTPESGNVDFTTLHTLLHIIVRKLGSQHSRVDLSPEHQDKLEPLLDALEKDPAVQVSIVQNEGREQFQVHPYNNETDKSATPIRLSSDDLHEISERLDSLERSVSILPSEEELQQYQSSRESLKKDEPVDFINLASRIDVMEINIGKLTALANDVLVEFARLEKLVVPYLDGGDIAAMKTQLDNINHLLMTQNPGFCSRRSSDTQRASRRLTIDTLPADFYTKGVPSILQVTGQAARRSSQFSKTARSSSSMVVSEQIEKEIETIKNVLNSLITLLPLPEGVGNELMPTDSEISCAESQPAMRTNFHQKAASAIINLRSVQQEIDELFLEKEERIVTLETTQREAAEKLVELAKIMEGFKEQILDSQSKIEQLNTNYVSNFETLRMQMTDQLEKITNDMEYIKNDVMDRIIELENEIEDRVDFTLFRTRVSTEQFENSMATINQTLNDMDQKLITVKTDFFQQVDDLIGQLSDKIDRRELNSLEKKISNNMGLLQLRLNKLVKLQETIEAAGAKLRLVGNFNCISCDHQATMKALEDVVPRGRLIRSKTYYPIEMDAILEARKNRYCGGSYTKGGLRKSGKTTAQKLCEARELVNQIKKQSLDLGLNVVQPENPAYKVHL